MNVVGLINGSVAEISADEWAYIIYEADRRGCDYATVYQDEIDSRRQLDSDPFTMDELTALAESSQSNACCRVMKNALSSNME